MINEEEKIEVDENNEEDINKEKLAEEEQPEASQVEEPEVLDSEKNQIEELNKQILRAAADFDNFKRRTQRERVNLLKYANEKMLIDILPVLDNFERAINVGEPSTEIKSFIEGMEMIYRQLLEVLNKAGLSKIDALGKQFDPELHDAVMQVEDKNVEDNTIIADLRTGYLYHDKVIRASMVQVAQNN